MEIQFDKNSLHFLRTAEKTNKNIFLTAVAGAGKSTIINYFVQNTKKSVALLGTTGVSALNIGGKTIHSFFSISPNPKKPKALKTEQMELIRHTDVFIIDEVSMMRADLFDILNARMQRICQNEELFGGKQFIFVGDLLQLSPVPPKKHENQEDKKNGIVREEYERFYEKYDGLFFFDGLSFDISKFEIIQLTKVYRQDNPLMVKALNLVRDGVQSESVLEYFNKRVISEENEIDPHAIMITSRNADADAYNEKKLNENKNELLQSIGMVQGEYDEELPVEKFLKFKVGSRIMFLVNENKEQTYMNGTLGTIVGIDRDSVIVDIDDFGEVEIGKYVWTNIDGENEFGEPNIIGKYIQYPFRLAHAISIHKSQGKSFDKCIIHLGREAFAEGMLYVALSRVRSYEGLYLIRPIKVKDLKTSKKVLTFIRNNIKNHDD